MKNDPIIKTLFLGGFILICALIYSIPYLATWATTGVGDLPPSFAPDLYFYLNLSTIRSGDPGMVINPWYGVEVPLKDITHFRFALAFQAFQYFGQVLGNKWPTVVFCWNIIWIVLVCLGAIWLIGMMESGTRIEVLAMGLALLLMTDLTGLKAMLCAWLSLPSLKGFEDLILPYLRLFFPQVAIPLLLGYLAVQIQVFKRGNWIWLIAMVFCQLLAFMSFPYATILMAGTTVVTAVTLSCSQKRLPNLRSLAWLGLLCAVVDGLFLSIAGYSSIGGNVGVNSILNVDGSRLHDLFGGTFVLILALAAMISLTGNKAFPELKWTIVSLGLANAFLSMTDALLTPFLQVSIHMSYFVHTTMVLQVVYLFGQTYPLLRKRLPVTRWIVIVGIILTLLHGALVANGIHTRLLAANRMGNELANVLNAITLNKRDLVIAPATFVDDPASWVPLLTGAEVLFYRNAELVLSRSQQGEIHRYRQALYLYATGRDGNWISERLSNPEAKREQSWLALIAEKAMFKHNGSGREETLQRIKKGLVPLVTRLESKTDAGDKVFQNYRRILVIDYIGNPLFVKDRLLSYLKFVGEERKGSFLLQWFTPAQSEIGRRSKLKD